MDLQVLSGLLGSQDQVVLRVMLVCLGLQVTQGQLVPQEVQAHQVKQGHVAMLDLQEILDLRDKQEHEDLLVHQVLLEIEAQQDHQGLLAHRGPLAMLVYLVQLEELVGFSTQNLYRCNPSSCIWLLSNIELLLLYLYLSIKRDN